MITVDREKFVVKEISYKPLFMKLKHTIFLTINIFKLEFGRTRKLLGKV